MRFFLLGLGSLLAIGSAQAQPSVMPSPSGNPPITRSELLSVAIDPAAPVKQVRVQEITMAPGTKAPLHLHPCPTIGVLKEGAVAFQIEGQPVQHLKAGDAFNEPANARVARFDNEGSVPVKFVVFYLLGEGEKETIRMLPE